MPTLKENNYFTFSLKNEKVLSTDPERKYAYQFSHAQTWLLFQKIVANVPRERGSIILFGEKNGKMDLKGTLQRDSDLRAQFRNGSKPCPNGSSTDWFHYMVDLIQNHQYKKIRVYITGSL